MPKEVPSPLFLSYLYLLYHVVQNTCVLLILHTSKSTCTQKFENFKLKKYKMRNLQSVEKKQTPVPVAHLLKFFEYLCVACVFTRPLCPHIT
jgi:hypothetical protein